MLGVEDVVQGVAKGDVVKKKDVRDVVSELGKLCVEEMDRVVGLYIWDVCTVHLSVS